MLHTSSDQAFYLDHDQMNPQIVTCCVYAALFVDGEAEALTYILPT